MLYIRQTACISPQETIFHTNMNTIHAAVDGKLKAIEPVYENIPPNILRRMGKAVRMGIGAALQILKNSEPANGIIIGTANGGIDDCTKFLQQIIEYDEGILAPGNFVQSVPNAIAAQLGLLTKNQGYNITHVHNGLSFENALIDATMQLIEHPDHNYIVGGVEEISSSYYNIEVLKGDFTTASVSTKDFYLPESKTSVAGEGAAMFLVGSNKKNSIAKIIGIDTIHTNETEKVKQKLENFLKQYLSSGKIDLLISGENGNNRLLKFYSTVESIIGNNTPVVRFKHLCGEYASASSYATWLACQLFLHQSVPSHLLKKESSPDNINKIIIYNNFAGVQHSFVLIENLD